MSDITTNRFWFDTEFIEDGKTIDLLSIGIVAEDGREYYAEVAEADHTRADEWVRKNVLAHLTGKTKSRAVIAADIVAFVGAKPEFWAYYADYDWVALCQLYGRMIDLPEGWPMFCRDLKQWCADLGNPKLPEQIGAEHHALADARWNRQAWNYLSGYHPAPEPVAVDAGLVEHMVGRFLGWKLPADFTPDAGITFKADYNENTPWPAKHEPTGTNLFDAKQAEAMVRFMLEGTALTSLQAQVEALTTRLNKEQDVSVELQRHRDSWRSYAYGKRDKPNDFLDGNMSPREVTALEAAEAEVTRLRQRVAGLNGWLDRIIACHDRNWRHQREKLDDIIPMAREARTKEPNND